MKANGHRELSRIFCFDEMEHGKHTEMELDKEALI